MAVKEKNAEQVLENVEKLIDKIEDMKTSWNPRPRYEMYAVCKDLNIFDWWDEYLSKTQLKDMQKFLKEAIKLGYAGYVCFKVGATGCSNGMWAYKANSTTGHSPDGEALYKSFTPAYNYWSFCTAEDEWIPKADENHKGYDVLTTIKALEQAIREYETSKTEKEPEEAMVEETAEYFDGDDDIKVGLVYEDPEGVWEVIGFEDGWVGIKNIQEGNENYGLETYVVPAEVRYFLENKDW